MVVTAMVNAPTAKKNQDFVPSIHIEDNSRSPDKKSINKWILKGMMPNKPHSYRVNTLYTIMITPMVIEKVRSLPGASKPRIQGAAMSNKPTR
jgi:hypothetical protein